MIPQNEIWKDIRGYEGLYQVSNTGKICSAIKSRYRVLKPIKKDNGYLCVSLSKLKKSKRFYIHHLVMQAFPGDRPDKVDINHIDGNKANNNVFNLEYATRSENMAHARKIGLHNNFADGHYNAKLNSELVREIRWAYSVCGIGESEIAPSIGVSVRTVKDVLEYKTWRSVDE